MWCWVSLFFCWGWAVRKSSHSQVRCREFIAFVRQEETLCGELIVSFEVLASVKGHENASECFVFFFFGSVEIVQNMGANFPKNRGDPEARYLKKILTPKWWTEPPLAWNSLVFLGMIVSRLPVLHMGVSKNRDTPKWMVYNGKPY